MANPNRRLFEGRGRLTANQRATLQLLKEDSGEAGGGGGGDGTLFLDISETDLTDDTYYYYGGLRDTGQWQINRYEKADLDNRTEADEAGNPSQTSLALAWANRTTLTYA